MQIRTAAPAEWPAAFELALHQLGEEIRRTRLRNALTLVAGGEIDPAGIFVARDAAGIRGVQVCVLLPGASGLLWLPKTLPADGALEEHLVQTALDWLRSRGARLAQAILSPLESPQAASFLRRGFQAVTRLDYLEHALTVVPAPRPAFIRYETYADANQDLFHATLLRTYEGTLDCPELSGVRTLEEIIAGHKAQGQFRPERWWLALAGNEPVGVAMATEVADLEAWDLSYLGVVPEARRRGHGRDLAGHVLRVAKSTPAPKLILAVDDRNHPALQLYKELGFRFVDNREVYLHFLDRSLAGGAPEATLESMT